MFWEVAQTLSFRGSKSRNKVSVGEPAEGSLPNTNILSTLRNYQVLGRCPPGGRPPFCVLTCRTEPHRRVRARRSSSARTTETTSNNGYLGSRNDEERSEMRYVVRIAEFRESSNL